MSIHGRTKIPVPSFAPPILDDAKGTEDNTNDATQNYKLETRLIRIPLKVQCMIHLDNALQLHRHQQEQQGQPNSDRISFADFSKISSKVETDNGALLSPKDDNVIAAVSESKKNHRNPIAEDFPVLWNLSKAERFWHDLYCVAVPALYRVNDSTTHSNGDNIENNSNSSPQPKKRRRLAATALELIPRLAEAAEGSKNRLKELRRLVREASTHGIPKAKSDSAFRLLLAFRREKTNNLHGIKEIVRKDISADTSNSNSNNKTNESTTVDSLLRDTGLSSVRENDAGIDSVETSITTTIDDRIRARAKERERNLEQARAARKDPRDERVAIADALYSYACHILRRRRSRSQSTSDGPRVLASRTTTTQLGKGVSSRFSGRTANAKVPTIPSSKCIVSFKEVVQNGLPNRSRRETTRIMSDIVEVLSVLSNSRSDLSSSSSVAPRFLRWKDPKTGKAYGVPIAKNATVTIDTSDFKKVREILNRERVSNATVGHVKKRSASNDETNQASRAVIKQEKKLG